MPTESDKGLPLAEFGTSEDAGSLPNFDVAEIYNSPSAHAPFVEACGPFGLKFYFDPQLIGSDGGEFRYIVLVALASVSAGLVDFDPLTVLVVQ